MSNQHTRWRYNRLALSIAAVVGGIAAIPGQAMAAAPAAGTSIGNTATATYTDASSVARSVNSNTVNTTVQQVASFTLTADNTKFVTLGGQVTYPHVLTNTGNGTDTFRLTFAQSAGDQFDLNNVKIFADANGDGVPDNATDLTGTDISVQPGSANAFKFVVVGYAPGSGVNNGNQAVVTVTADSRGFENGVISADAANATNTDTATLTADAVIATSKSITVSSGPTGTTTTYTLTYTNTGNNTATGVKITDLLPAGMTYVAGSAKWNSSTLTDATGGDPAGIAYDFGVTTAGTATATIASVAPNVTGQITFSVTVAAGTAPGVQHNTFDTTYDPDGAGPKTDVGPVTSNDAPFTVTQTASVFANDDNNPAHTTASQTSAGGIDDIVEVASANQGATVVFNNEIWNNGNGSDTFNIALSGSNFPAGTAFQIYKSDGNNLLADTNGDGIPDTGPLAAGGHYTVIVKATLPNGASGNNGGAGFTVTKTATSTFNPTVSDTVTDKLDAIAANTVDITNDAASGGSAKGVGAGTNTILNSTPVNPGQSATFVLYVSNTSAVADNYNLIADQDGVYNGSNDLPSGWTATFYLDGTNGNCSNFGAQITNTGTINAGANLKVCAVIGTPSTATPVSQSIYFQSKSPISGAADYKRDEVVVNTVRALALTTGNSGQVFPGGTVVYTHILKNNGNVTEGSVAGEILLSGSNTLGGFTTTLYYDTDGDGVLSAGDTQFTDVSALTGTPGGVGLQPGEQIRVFAKIQADPAATPGTTDTATIHAAVTGTINSIAAPTVANNLDVTQVIGGQIRLTKSQALDAACDGTPDAAYTTANMSAKPNQCIVYQIVAENQGVSPVTSVLVNDATPTYTKLDSTNLTPNVTVGSITTVPANGATGALQANVGTLNGGQSATMTFEVRIDN